MPKLKLYIFLPPFDIPNIDYPLVVQATCALEFQALDPAMSFHGEFLCMRVDIFQTCGSLLEMNTQYCCYTAKSQVGHLVIHKYKQVKVDAFNTGHRGSEIS